MVSILRVFFDFYHVVYAALELYLVGRSKSYHRSLGVPHEKRTKKGGLISYFGLYESYHGRKAHRQETAAGGRRARRFFAAAVSWPSLNMPAYFRAF